MRVYYMDLLPVDLDIIDKLGHEVNRLHLHNHFPPPLPGLVIDEWVGLAKTSM